MDKQTAIKNLKQNLKLLRNSKKLSQKDAAKIFGISLSSYQKYELDGPIMPSFQMILKIADYYSITLDGLIGRTMNDQAQKVSITDLLMQNMTDAKIDINDLLLQTFKNWSNIKQKEVEQKLSTARRLVYVNFESQNPHSKFMDGEYDKSESHLFFEIPSDARNISTYMAAANYDIGWTDPYGVHHVERIIAGGEYFFPSDIITDTPKF